MAQILREGCTYSLIAEESANENRKVYFVKLTDSCLKAIEEYTDDFKSGSKMKSIIRFDDANSGAVIIPNSSINGMKKTFVFAISNVITSDTNPLQECIKCHWKSDKLLSYGPLEQKISIAATDDCYENTRNRMAQVDQERKDIRTKEIKLGSMKKGRKSVSKMVVPDNHNKTSSVKTIRKINPPPRSTIPTKPVLSSTSHVSKPVSSLTNHVSKPAMPSTTHVSKPAMSSTTHVSKATALPSTTHVSKPVSSSTTHVSKSVLPPITSVSAATSFKKSPLKNSPKPSSNLNSPSTTATKEFTCRDRVLHILSLRPHKKQELITRLQREGMTQKDRCSLPMILQQVASFVDNQYTLHPNLYAHLQVETWPFYNENERNNVKQNIASSKKSESTSSQHVSSTSKSPEDSKSSKRPLPTKTDHANKKPKVENSEEPTSTSISPNENVAVSSTSDDNKPKGEESPQTVASTSDSPEYLSMYKPITSKEQRFQYKRDFQLEYEEYIKLKKYLDSVTSKFMELENSLNSTEEGTPEYIRIQDEIVTTYNKQQQDERYGRTKCRYEKLTKKLSHIKRLVMEYDSSIGNS